MYVLIAIMHGAHNSNSPHRLAPRRRYVYTPKSARQVRYTTSRLLMFLQNAKGVCPRPAMLTVIFTEWLAHVSTRTTLDSAGA